MTISVPGRVLPYIWNLGIGYPRVTVGFKDHQKICQKWPSWAFLRDNFPQNLEFCPYQISSTSKIQFQDLKYHQFGDHHKNSKYVLVKYLELHIVIIVAIVTIILLRQYCHGPHCSCCDNIVTILYDSSWWRKAPGFDP